jgi:hypothetical protein
MHEVRFNRVDVNFFRTFEVPILAGRGFGPADLAPTSTGSSVQNEDASEGGAVVVNQSFAQRVFRGNALGRRIRYAGRRRGPAARSRESMNWYEIVGVVSDFSTGVNPGMRGSTLKVYHAVAAGQVQPAEIAIRIRGGAPATFSQRLGKIATDIDPDLHLRNIPAWTRRCAASSGSAACKRR